MADPRLPASHLALIGMMGAGKSAVGARLADRTSRELRDVDATVAARAGDPVPALIERIGMAAFRRLEAEVLQQALAANEPSIIATGGGAVLDERSRELLVARSTVVWLRARPETLAERVGDGATRPLLAGQDALVALRALGVERDGLYAATAAVAVDTDGRPVEEVADAVLAAVAATTSTPERTP